MKLGTVIIYRNSRRREWKDLLPHGHANGRHEPLKTRIMVWTMHCNGFSCVEGGDSKSLPIQQESITTELSKVEADLVHGETRDPPFSIPQLTPMELTILANYLFHCGSFLHQVTNNINSYRSQCSFYQITPIKHLSKYGFYTFFHLS